MALAEDLQPSADSDSGPHGSDVGSVVLRLLTVSNHVQPCSLPVPVPSHRFKLLRNNLNLNVSDVTVGFFWNCDESKANLNFKLNFVSK